MTHLLIIGGSDAGISAALRAKELDSKVDVTVVVADSFPNYSICGIPFYLSGEVPDWRNLAHRTAEEITQTGINLLLNHTAQTVYPAKKSVEIVDQQGQVQWLTYDKLIVATGAVPVKPAIEGLELPGVFLLHSMEDTFAVHQHLTNHAPQSVVIVGGGYIGLEMADALTHRGIAVTLVEHSATVMKTVDPSLGQVIGEELRRHNVEVINRVEIETIEQKGTQLIVSGTGGFHKTTDMVLVAVGVRPLTDLAPEAGLKTGQRGAIQVNRKMETNVPDIYAAGDCVETWHRLLNEYTYLPLGTTAHKQGRIAGENAVGGEQEFAGSLGTQVVKIFDLAVARTGLRDAEAQGGRFNAVTVEMDAWDHKVYYPGAHKLRIRITGDAQNGRLLGAQMVGHYQGEVAKRIDIFATALFHGMNVDELNELDLSYTPPLSSPWDPVQMSAQAWVKQQIKYHS
ncbi:FAD-dependent oxidoreductase [Scytonema sp. PRP1]|uniref:FAD-dependent oxidoreductase n=1 Tax=Scytonema sp. PRP1 TaxID=3120513 RepID=UPI00300D7A60